MTSFSKMLSINYLNVQRIWKNFVPRITISTNLGRACSIINSNTAQKYNEADKNYILKILNENSTSELSRFDISKARINKLEQWRTKRGKFGTIFDVLEVDGFGIKVLEKFCNSILDIRDNKLPDKPKQKLIVSKKVHNFITPTLTDEDFQKISSVTAIHIGVSTVSWSVLDINSSQVTLKNWGLHDFTKENKRMHITQILHLAVNITKLIPHGEIYVLEAPQTNLQNSGPNQKTYVASTEKLQIISMISASLASRVSDTQNLKQDSIENTSKTTNTNNVTYEDFNQKNIQHGVYYLRNMLPARLYRTLIGNERISTESVINDIFNRTNTNTVSSEQNKSNKYNPIILEPLKSLYESATPIHKEHLGHALLLGMACLRVCILHDKDSIQKITSRQ